jgi:predicted AAA+ superfamily ATPase
MINRVVENSMYAKLSSNKVLLLLGARRTGKTCLLEQLVKKVKTPYLLLNGEDFKTTAWLQNKSLKEYKSFIGRHKLLLIDEAQHVENIGAILKLLIDGIKDLTIIATGSSAFDLTQQLGEPLTGRSLTYHLFPIAQYELRKHENALETAANLEHRLIYGAYPELFQYESLEEQQQYLSELVNSYLLKDILAYDGIRNSAKLLTVLRLVAFQTGSEVSLTEIGQRAGLTRNTVERYMDLLEKVYIVFKVGAYSRNLRKEIVKNHKYYFWDNGIRNTLVANFNPLPLRNDVGALWENYVISERMKYQSYKRILSYNYFWRTYDGQEIDWVEERNGKLSAYEFKYSADKAKLPAAFARTYPQSIFTVVNSKNYLPFIS